MESKKILSKTIKTKKIHIEIYDRYMQLTFAKFENQARLFVLETQNQYFLEIVPSFD